MTLSLPSSQLSALREKAEPTKQEVAFIHREYVEIVNQITQAILPIHQRHASTDRYAMGASEAQVRIMEAIQPTLLASARRYGKVAAKLDALLDRLEALEQDRKRLRAAIQALDGVAMTRDLAGIKGERREHARWEYRCYEPREDYGTVRWDLGEINALGAEGWEAVGVVAGVLLLKRPLAPEGG